ncbi:MAG: crotonase/enoyl-CoA hydratase family protein [Ilumatobacteraceae bacterium]|jgi:enoyl-CoA hydratase/carnithine racemase|nr:crotonase/enoyl-CoA hydratase family protein [Ilumatobacteraceae bacterium]
MTNRVTLAVADGIADVRLNRPDKRNALDPEMFAALVSTGEALKSRDDVRVVVLSGEGASFCAGLDLASMGALAGDTNDQSSDQPTGDRPSIMGTGGRITHLAQQSAWAWQEVPMPVIAALHGHALGGGIQIAMGADIRIAHPATKFSVRETFWGLIPDMTGTLTITRHVRPDIAKELVFTARIFDGTEARSLGLVTSLSEDPFTAAMSLAREICAVSPDAVRGAKELINSRVNEHAADQFASERTVIQSLIGEHNQVESVTAYFEKRNPRFVDATIRRS